MFGYFKERAKSKDNKGVSVQGYKPKQFIKMCLFQSRQAKQGNEFLGWISSLFEIMEHVYGFGYKSVDHVKMSWLVTLLNKSKNLARKNG